ncbi:polysaccharide pyruvyl transferase CsaB [Tindallia californiensis]|uniref:Polysaccharide pyruvyl transferase CsaB n=1 Tax=Tindallia californiensis TaxID=159292 RepID=A0A1H3K5Z6_9FIRM|nr:polysaccharide pyruvyl transferase CsaB [Tindallia californiensis]SDY46944.1 polysaccharide pyruvyl transferase CsaB [Tindallia californiensis]
MKRIFMFGYYGFNNIGDEAILEAIVESFRAEIPRVQLAALSYKASETEKRYQIEAVSRNQFWQVVKKIGHSDVVMSGGGSILQDITSSRSLLYYLGIILLAKMAGKKVVFYGNGFGPINRPFNKWLAKMIINKVDLITLRDNESKKVMESLGISRAITVTADAAFNLEALNCQENLSFKEPIVGISIRNWKGKENYCRVIALCADQLVKRGYRILFLPMHHPSDIRISEEVASMMESPSTILDHPMKPREMIAQMSKLNFLIGMRLHSLIFAAIAGTPMVGLSYESKVSSFLNQVRQPCAGYVESLTEQEIMESIDLLIKERKGYVTNLTEAKKELSIKARENAKMLREFMDKGEKW